MPAILDMKWSYLSYDNGPQAAIADSEGRISTYRWSHAENQLLPLQTAQVAESTVLCLSLDWSGRQIRGSSESLVVSLSSGHISVLSHLNSGELDTICTWKAHDYEPWIAAWDYWSPNIAYSGGDDCRLKGWDIRLDGSGPIFDNKRFEAGVTTIQSHPNAQYLLAVGSYDSIVRIFDTRKPLVPIQQVDVGGGVWRVKWHPSPTRKSDLLTACMHDGFKVIDLGTNGAETSNSPGITHSFDEHASLAYGVDWSHRDISGTLVASCSFYDHVLHTWKA
ncbi:hypothetical protein FRC03_008769 [Tulasnella sp. 419]|nr:hypothetical protein FRC02_004463 [Tulasnella sp. 418]KAG8968070.1 hypothetical protein FRC03_008769 [Tulasnella sp. 419]